MQTRLAFVVWLIAATISPVGSMTLPVVGWSVQEVSGWLLLWSLFSGPVERFLCAVISPDGEKIEFDTDSGVGRGGALLKSIVSRVASWFDNDNNKKPPHKGQKVTIQVAPKEATKG